MALMRFDPFRDLDRLTEQVVSGGRVARTMPMEAFRRGDELLVYVDLPGVEEQDVDVTVERNVVTLRAERRSPLRQGDEVLVDERPHGTFSRQLFLGDNLDAGRLTAEYDAGVLLLTIPIAEASKPRRIQVGGPSGYTIPEQAGSAAEPSGEQAGRPAGEATEQASSRP